MPFTLGTSSKDTGCASPAGAALTPESQSRRAWDAAVRWDSRKLALLASCGLAYFLYLAVATLLGAAMKEERPFAPLSDHFAVLLVIACGATAWQRERARRRQYESSLREIQAKLIEALKSSEIIQSYLKASGEAINEALLFVDDDNVIIYCNPTAEKMFGWPDRTLVGKSLDILIPIRFRRAHLGHVRAYRNDPAESGAKRNMGDWRKIFGLKSDGSEFRVHASIVRSECQHHGITMVALRDMSITYQLESDLKSAASMALSFDEAKTQFLANISHEFRTPLNAILGFSEILALEINGALNERQKGYVQDILTAGGMLRNLLSDILSYAKLAAGEIDFIEQEEDILRVAQKCAGIMGAHAMRKNIRIDVAAPDDIPKLVCDARAIKQIILHLLSNAIKFSPDNSLVQVQVDFTDGQIDLSVIDNGVGIALKDLSSIFEPFRQVENSLSRANDGVGIGLSMVRALVLAHGGQIRVRSEPGQGSAFTISFPGERCATSPHAAMPANPADKTE